jgi:uncharacterized protein (DUF924 family)
MENNTGTRSGLLSYLSLFTSFGTLLCCALPSLLVLLGLGAVFVIGMTIVRVPVFIGFVAAVIVLDQFSRNMFRSTPRAFANDAKALSITQKALAKGFAGALSSEEQLFLYLPCEHQENVDAQARSVELISALGDPELTKFAQAHKDVIDRFGRFPHRNGILGRISTAEELEFLKCQGSSF